MIFTVGDTHPLKIGQGGPYKIHILAIIDGDQIVYKWYGRHKQWWNYEIRLAQILAVQIEYAAT